MQVLRVSRRSAAAVCSILLLVGLVACGDDDPALSPATTSAVPTTSSPAGPTTSAPATTSTAPPTTVAGTTISVVIQSGAVAVSSPSDACDASRRRCRVTLNQPVTLMVTSDVADEVHVHAYDRFAAVGPGAPAQLTFPASIPGVIEVELERTHRLILTLEVAP